MHVAGFERRAGRVVERREDPDIGWVAVKGAAADLRELLDVVGSHLP